jgi:hypothetical protein
MQKRVSHDEGASIKPETYDGSHAREARAVAELTKRQRLNYYTGLSVVTILAFSDEHGRMVLDACKAEDIDKSLVPIFEACVEFWNKYGKAPKQLLPDAVAHHLGPSRFRKVEHLLQQIQVDNLAGVDAQFAIDMLHSWKQKNLFAGHLLSALGKVDANPAKIDEVAHGLSEYLNKRTRTASDDDDTISVGDPLPFDDEDDGSGEFSSGIAVLDSKRICPRRSAIAVMVADTKKGKTWNLIDVGVANARRGKSVLHVTLELSRDLTHKRYRQCFYGVPARELVNEDGKEIKSVTLTRLYDDKGRPELSRVERSIKGTIATVSPSRWLRRNGSAQRWDRRYAEEEQGTLDSIKIKYWPENTLTSAQLRAYIEGLKVKGLMPDMLIVDYAEKLKIEGDDYRHEFGRRFGELRNIAIDYNIAVVTAAQANRMGGKAERLDKAHTAEDYSIVQRADLLLTLSQNEDEKKLGLARIEVAAARNEADGFTALISQCFTLGMFCIDSCTYDKQGVHSEDAMSALLGDTSKVKPVSSDEMDKAVAALKANGEDRWRLDRRAKDWVGKAIADAVAGSEDRLAAVVAALIKAGKLERFQAQDNHREMRDFVRLASEAGDLSKIDKVM